MDVVTNIAIARPRSEVAAYASSPDRATDWYANIKSIEWKTPGRLAVGSRIAFVAVFLGRQLAYTYEVIEHAEGERFVMRTTQGPFPMETTYLWEDAADGATKMTLRNRGQATGFSKLASPFMARATRRANRKDLGRLRRLLESAPRKTPS